MITESEKKALQLAKRVFEHFTHNAMPIAREIIAMELELGEAPLNREPPDGLTKPILEVKKTDGQLVNELLNDFPASDLVSDDPAQPIKQLSEELVYQPQNDFPF